VRAGGRALGPAAFRDDVGHFWGILATRPYMRVRQGLAAVLWALGERQVAIAHVQEPLRLNPGDNQGLRYTLATWLLAAGDDAALADLLRQYRRRAAPPGPIPAPWPRSVATVRAGQRTRRSGRR